MLKISYAGCLGLSPVISVQFTLEMCVAASNREKITKNPYLGVQGRLRSSMLVLPESSAYFDVQQVCVYLQPFSC